MFNLAYVGVGGVFQTAHLPLVLSMKDKFFIHGIYDSNILLAEKISSTYDIKKFDSLKDLVLSDVDCIILTAIEEYRKDIVLEIAAYLKERQKHLYLMIEKPIAITESQILAIEKALSSEKVTFLPAYMRMHSKAYEKFKSLINMDDIKSVYVREFAGGVLNTDFKPISADVNEELKKSLKEKQKQLTEEVFGKDYELKDVSHWRALHVLGSHSISMIVDIFGAPKKVYTNHNTVTNNLSYPEEVYSNVVFEFEKFILNYEMSWGDPCWEAFIEIRNYKGQTIKFDLENPYSFESKHIPTSITTYKIGDNQTVSKEILDNISPFREEYNRLFDVMNGSKKPLLSIEQVKEHVCIINDIVKSGIK